MVTLLVGILTLIIGFVLGVLGTARRVIETHESYKVLIEHAMLTLHNVTQPVDYVDEGTGEADNSPTGYH